jgi:hypothetical protein
MMPQTKILSVFMMALLHASCASVGTKHLTADEFVNKARMISGPEKPPFPVYIGVGHNLAYLENWGRFRGIRSPKTIVYWTELDELPDELAARLKAGENPWESPDKSRN